MQPEVPSANSGISDFSSAIDIASRRDENASKEMPSVLIESDNKANNSHQVQESDTLVKQGNRPRGRQSNRVEPEQI